MRVLQFSIARRRFTTTPNRRDWATSSFKSRCDVSASRNFHSRSAVSSSLASSSSSPSYDSLSSNSPSWQTNLLILAGAGLASSSYLSTSDDNSHNVSRCDTNVQTTPKDDTATVVSSSSPTQNPTEAAASSPPSSSEQPIENDEDEETHCTICLINRQGPCRPYWRKFERCMKDQGRASESEKGDDTTDKDDSSSSSASTSMGEKCDTLMMPWITCIQSHRNTYTLISNRFFQDEYVDAVEKGVREDDKVNLGGAEDDDNPNSIDWKQFVEFSDFDWLKMDGEAADKDEETVVVRDGEECPDAKLVEGVARINLWDGDGKGKNGRRRVDLAYVRDQDGLLLGHERFEMKKKETVDNGGEDSNDGENIGTSDAKAEPEERIGNCAFHVSPETTKAIQIFALYGKDDDDITGNGGIQEAKSEDGTVEDAASDTDKKDNIESNRKQTLYHSGLIPLSELKPIKEIPVTTT